MQETFTATTTWTMEHPWGEEIPYVTAIDSNGDVRLVAPIFTDGQVQIVWGQATAGTLVLQLIGDNESPVPELAARPFVSAAWRNSFLVEIRSAPSVDENGDQADLGVLLWAGQAGAYLSRKRRTQGRQRMGTDAGAQSVEVDTDVLWITDLEGVPVIESPGARWKGSQVTVDDCRTATPVRRRFTVRAMEHRAAGLDVDNVRLELDAEVTV